jgi:hypothetical protein
MDDEKLTRIYVDLANQVEKGNYDVGADTCHHDQVDLDESMVAR